MQIVTTDAFTGESVPNWALSWQGPRVLAVLPGSPISRSDLKPLEDQWYVFEFLQRPASSAALMCTVLNALSHILRSANWPLLFTNRPMSGDEVAEMHDLGMRSPAEVRFATDASGATESLLLGKSVLTSPLAPGFFGYLVKRPQADADFVRLIEKHLLKDRR